MLPGVSDRVLMGVALAVFLALGAAAGVQTWRLAVEQRDHAETKNQHAEKIGQLERAAREAVEEARKEERRRAEALQGVIDDAEKDLAQSRADAADAAAAGERLRQRLAALTASCRRGSGDSAAAAAGPPAEPAADLLERVQRWLDDAADGIARYADQAGAAGRACERSYDALTVR